VNASHGLGVASVALALLLAAAGSASTPPQAGSAGRAALPPSVQATVPQSRPIWPEPPAPTKISYVGSLAPASAQARPSVLGRIWRAIAGPGTAPVMSQPYGMAVGKDRSLYVTDTVGGVIHVFDLAKRGYRRMQVDADSLVGIASRDDHLYVTDAVRGRVTCLTTNGRKLWSTGSDASLQRPTGIVATADRLFVVDTIAAQVVELGPQGTVVRRFGGHGTSEGTFNFPTAIATDGRSQLYVTDTLNFRVQVFDLSGRFVRTFGRLGDGSGDFTRPKGLALDSDGNIHVVEGLHDVIQVFDREGAFLLAYGESGTGTGQLWLPTGITIAGDSVFVADSANRRVQIYQYLRDTR
jgi:sugar lactone lactonase YvrE